MAVKVEIEELKSEKQADEIHARKEADMLKEITRLRDALSAAQSCHEQETASLRRDKELGENSIAQAQRDHADAIEKVRFQLESFRFSISH